MAIVINHRFINRLNSTTSFEKINIIIVGTFNPGPPEFDKLNETERAQFEEIRTSNKYKKFNQVKNFYDRPQNRFWKIMDYLNDKHFYEEYSVQTKNMNGLKYYNGMDRDEVFKRQLKFCQQRGVLITDLVKQINPISFCDIYDNFPDKAIEKAKPVWNTDAIIQMVEEHHPKKILINFSGNSTPNISSQVARIKKQFPNMIIDSLLSTSGAAGNKYDKLINDWGKHFA